MANLRRIFTNGAMQKDVESRLMNDGDYRDALNVIVLDSDNSDSGAVQNVLSNKQLTNFDFGVTTAPRTIGVYADDAQDLIYSFIKSDNGCYIFEWDNKNEVLSVVLADTRAVGSRVLDLQENYLITGVQKIHNDNSADNLFLWTDDNMEPCCINLERAKSWGENNFVLEDILLIKKPPRYAPVITPVAVDELANNLLEKFVSFSYQYRYPDGEYSAISDYTNYCFYPKSFDLDYYTMDNLGMLNSFNAVRIDFNTGEPQVTDVRLIAKESNSNNLYVIETFNIKEEGWAPNQVKSYTFSNNKLYKVLAEKELYRAFDNVPLKAKALTLIGNRPIFGNYLEGRDLIDQFGNKVYVDYTLSLINEEIDVADPFDTVALDNTMTVDNPTGILLKEGNKLTLYFNLTLDGQASYENSFYFILPQDYSTINDMFSSLDFANFMVIVDNHFRNSYAFTAPGGTGYNVTVNPEINFDIIAGVPTFTVTPVTFEDSLDFDSLHTYDFTVLPASAVNLAVTANSTTLKTNRDYEVGVIYEDDFNRKTTVLTSLYNTIYVPQKYSIYKNRIKVTLNHLPPAWADRYKIVVKAKPLQYETIYVNRFYNEGFYVWCKLEAENKDKVKPGDILIVKKAADNILINPVEVKVLAVESKNSDFIPFNVDDNGNLIVEEAGYYMKIRPDRFSMDFDDYKIYQSKFGLRSYSTPILWLDLFTQQITPTIVELAVPVGSSVSIYIHSNRKYDDGWKDNTYAFTFFAQRNYASVEEFLDENLLDRPLFGNFGNTPMNYQYNLFVVRGFPFLTPGGLIITPNPLGKAYLQVVGTFSGGSNNRQAGLEAHLVIRTNTGFYVFETNPKQGESNIFYETEQAFDIVNGNHTVNGNTGPNWQDQDASSFVPAIIDLDFFNCYTQGNGVESYKVKDGFNKNFLNIDLRPSATSLEPYRGVRHQADMTYGDPYVESTNINGLNVFNISTGNWKELDKQYGSIQALLSRDNDIVVLQEEKASKVLFKKRAIVNADGSENVVTADIVLGDQRTYLGENGIGKNPESIAVNDFQIFYTNVRRGIVQRLSLDGVTDICLGMVNYFRDLFIAKPDAKKVGVYDPYYGHYILGVGEEPPHLFEANCGNFISKSNQTLPFQYKLNLNSLTGTIIISYNISGGNATVVVTYDGSVYTESNVTGSSAIFVPRSDLNEDFAIIEIAPVGGATIDYDITNTCPTGSELEMTTIVLNDDADTGLTITNRFRWGLSSFYSDSILFGPAPITLFSTEVGTEGVGKFPQAGEVVNIQSFKDSSNTGRLLVEKCNRIGYLVSPTAYTSADIDTILSAATWLGITTTQVSLTTFTDDANFLFNRMPGERLYIIYDYTDRLPVLVDDTYIVYIGQTVSIFVAINDSYDPLYPMEIVSGPGHGDATIIDGNTIYYANDGDDSFDTDTIVYQVGEGDCVATATLTITLVDPNNYCVTWLAVNETNIKMTLEGTFDFTGLLAGRTIDTFASAGTITAYRIDGVDVSSSIPMSFTTTTATFDTDALPVVTDKVLTQITAYIELIFTNAEEFTIESLTAALETPGQMEAEYDSCD